MCDCHCEEVFNCDVKICGDLKVQRDVTVRRNLFVSCSSVTDGYQIIPRVNISETEPSKGAIAFNKKDQRLYYSDGKEWRVVTDEISAHIQVAADTKYPTVNSAFDFLRGRIIKDVTIDIAPGTYNESLLLDDIISNPSNNQALPAQFSPVPSGLPAPGLTLRGDPRYICSMSYIDGAQLNYFNQRIAIGYVRKMGTPYGLVSLTHPAANTIQSSITAIPINGFESGPPILEQPDFNFEDVQPGDTILLRNPAGIWVERIITSVIGNILTYNGADVPVYSALNFCPRVRIIGDGTQDFTLLGKGLGIAIQGIWFRSAALQTFNVFFSEKSVVLLGQCLFEDIPGNSPVNLFINSDAYVSGVETAINHNTVIGALFDALLVQGGGTIDYGDFQVFDAGNVNVFFNSANTSSNMISLNSVGGNRSNLSVRLCNLFLSNLLGAYNLKSPGFFSVPFFGGAQVILFADNLVIDQTLQPASSGIGSLDGSKFVVINRNGTGFGSRINRASNGIIIQLGSDVDFRIGTTLQITNIISIGILGISTSRFILQGNINFSGNGLDRIFDANSTYNAARATDTPNDILQIGINPVFEPSIPKQVTSVVSVPILTLNPSAVSAGAARYQGKNYFLYNIDGSSHTLNLQGATFIGTGVPAGANSVTFTGLGAGINFIVLNSTQVLVISSFGTIFAIIVLMALEQLNEVEEFPEIAKCYMLKIKDNSP